MTAQVKTRKVSLASVVRAFCQGEGLQLDPGAWFVDRRLSWRVLDAAADAMWCGAIR